MKLGKLLMEVGEEKQALCKNEETGEIFEMGRRKESRKQAVVRQNSN